MKIFVTVFIGIVALSGCSTFGWNNRGVDNSVVCPNCDSAKKFTPKVREMIEKEVTQIPDPDDQSIETSVKEEIKVIAIISKKGNKTKVRLIADSDYGNLEEAKWLTHCIVWMGPMTIGGQLYPKRCIYNPPHKAK